MNYEDQEIELQEIVKIFLKKWYYIVASVFIFGLGGFLYQNYFLDDTFTASTKLIIITENEAPIDGQSLQFGEALLGTYSELAKSRRVLSFVLADLDLDLSVEQLSSTISVNGVQETIIINLLVETNDPMLSYNIANSTSLAMQNASFDFEGLDNIEVLDLATIPGSPSGPNRLLYIVISIVLGGMIGVGLTLTLHFFDQRIVTLKDLESLKGMRALGEIELFDNKLDLGERTNG